MKYKIQYNNTLKVTYLKIHLKPYEHIKRIKLTCLSQTHL